MKEKLRRSLKPCFIFQYFNLYLLLTDTHSVYRTELRVNLNDLEYLHFTASSVYFVYSAYDVLEKSGLVKWKPLHSCTLM